MSAEMHPNPAPRPQAPLPDWKKPLGLAVALTVLGGGAIWYETSFRPKKEEAEQGEKKIFQLKDTGVAELRLRHEGKTWKFSCQDDPKKLCKPGDQSKWQMIEPLHLKADDSNVNSILSALKNVQSQESIDLSKQPAEKKTRLLGEYGLPEEGRKNGVVREITLTDAEGKTRTFWMGATHPIGEGIFTISSTVGDSTVFVLPTHFKSHFERDLRYWRNKKLMSLATGDIQHFEISGQAGKVQGTRADGQWNLTGEAKAAATGLAGDNESIDSLLSAVANLTAKDFLAEKKASPEARAALTGAKKVLSLQVQSKAKKAGDAVEPPIGLDLFEKAAAKKGENAKLFAQLSSSDPLYELDVGARKRLDKGLSDLRLSKLLSSLERYATKRIEFSGKEVGAKPLTLLSKEGKWQTEPMTTPEDSFDSELVQKILDRLSGSRIQEFIDAKKAPVGEASGLKVVLFQDEAGQKKREFIFWRSADGKTAYAHDLASKRPEVFKVDITIIQTLPNKADFFVKAKPETKPAAHSTAQKDH
jgi:hypothetical protein